MGGTLVDFMLNANEASGDGVVDQAAHQPGICFCLLESDLTQSNQVNPELSHVLGYRIV